MQFKVVQSEGPQSPPLINFKVQRGLTLSPNIIRWEPVEDVDSVKIYRSRIGLKTKAPPFGIELGDGILFGTTWGKEQQCPLSSDANLLMDLSKLSHVKVFEQDDGSFWIISEWQQEGGLVEVLSGAVAAEKLGLSVGLVSTFLSDWELIAEIADPSLTESYEDVSGLPSDYYRVTTVTDEEESVPSPWMQPLMGDQDLCVLSGRVLELDGKPAAHVEINAKIAIPGRPLNEILISSNEIKALTNKEGYFSLPVLQGVPIIIEASSIGYIKPVLVPQENYMKLTAEMWDYYKYSGTKDVDQENF